MKFAAHIFTHDDTAALRRSRRSRPMLWIRTGLAALALLALSLTGELTGAPQQDTVAIAPLVPVSRKIEWRPVAGSHGYLLQLRDQNARLIIERRLETSKTRLTLQPGSYSLRVASLNKFGKPASWSAWAGLNIERPKPRQDSEDAAASTDAAPGNAEPSNVNKATHDDAPEGAGFRWQALVPGLSQFQRGQTWRGLAWMTGFAGLGATGYSFWQTGNNLALNAEATTPLLLLAPLSGQTATAFFLLNDRAGARAAHSAAQANQQTIGLVAGVLYLLQIADALWLSESSSAVQPDNDSGNQSGITALRVGRFQLQAELYSPAFDQERYTRNQFGANVGAGNGGAHGGFQGIQLQFRTRF